MSELELLWQAVAHVAHARVAVVARAVRATCDGAPDAAEQRAVAVDECHKLVGSLDSYGRTGGSRIALRTAELLAAAEPDLPALAVVVRRLEQAVSDPAPRPG